MKCFICLSTIFIILSFSANAQATDNTGKDLFVVKTSSGLSFPISSTGFSLNFISSFNNEDTLEISRARFFKEKARHDERLINRKSIRKEPFMIIMNGDTTYYDIVHRKGIDLTSYYGEEGVRKLLRVFRDSLPKGSFRSVFHELDTTGYTRATLVDSLITKLKEKNLPIPSIYSVTDVGSGVKPFFVNLKVSNLSIKSFGNFFSNANQPTIQLEVGGIQNTVLKFNDWDELRDTKGFLKFYEYDFFYSAYINTNCIDYIDTVNQKRTPYSLSTLSKFMQYGVKANFNVYKSKNVAFAFTTNLWYGLPFDNDKSFQTGASKTIFPADTLHKALGQSAGKYGGDIDNKLLNARVSVAVPIFFDISRAVEWVFGFTQPRGSKFYFLPSYAPFISSSVKWTNQVGLSLNLLSQPYGPINSTIVQAGGFGFDLLSNSKAKTGWGSPIFYISGTINLGSIVNRNGAAQYRGTAN